MWEGKKSEAETDEGVETKRRDEMRKKTKENNNILKNTITGQENKETANKKKMKMRCRNENVKRKKNGTL